MRREAGPPNQYTRWSTPTQAERPFGGRRVPQPQPRTLIQGSENPGFGFWQAAPFSAPQVFDENAEGEYTYRLTALDSSLDELGSVEINVIVGNPVVPVDVPEPGTVAMFGIGLLGLGYARRKRQS